MKRTTFFLMALCLMISTASSAQDYERILLERAMQVHDKVISVDTHTDTALDLVNGVEESRIQASPARLREGRVDCCFYPIYSRQRALTDSLRIRAFENAKSKMTGIESYIQEHSPEMEVALCVDDIERLKKEGKLSLVMGLENTYPIGRDLDKLREFYSMGARIMTLCHNYHNDICDAAIDTLVAYHGLSEFGYKVVDEMNRLGIVIDVSHASTETVMDCLEYSKAPVVASHSCVYNLKHHKRNLQDSEIKAIAAKGGVIQVTTGKWALSDLPESEVNISTFCDHVEYIRNLVGVQYVGIGTDFDGGGGMVELEDASRMKYITVEFLRRGWSEEDLRLFWGGNILRVMREVEKVSAGIRNGER